MFKCIWHFSHVPTKWTSLYIPGHQNVSFNFSKFAYVLLWPARVSRGTKTPMVEIPFVSFGPRLISNTQTSNFTDSVFGEPKLFPIMFNSITMFWELRLPRVIAVPCFNSLL